MRRLFAILPFITLLTAASPLAAATVPILPEDGRFTMAVTIDGHDLRFVVDSAAQSTFMAGEVARALGLAVTSDPQNGDSVAVKHYASGLFDRHDDTLALVQRTGMSVADGVVGMDLFAGQQIAYDFADFDVLGGAVRRHAGRLSRHSGDAERRNARHRRRRDRRRARQGADRQRGAAHGG